ncbi:MAG TPA: ABC transporter permease [Polyangia bacterium]|jgi:ABC-type polysaccharide/polyol phosphate export permease
MVEPRGDRAGARPNPVIQLTLMRLRELRREPGTLFWVFGFPILISIALGLAFRTTGPEPVAVGVLPGVSAEVTRALADGGVKVTAMDEATARNELRAGHVALVLAPPGSADRGAVTYRFDPMRPEARLGRAVVDDVLQRAAGRRDPRPVRDEIVRERGARYIDFLIPGLIGMNLMSGSMWGIGWVLVNMRVRKLLKRLLAAPMRRRHLFYGQALARLVMIPIELTVILIFARLAFDVRMTGSWLALALVSLTGSASFAGVAILVASRAQNSETVSGLMNLVMLPMFVLSGVFFSSGHFPAFMQPAINALPLTALCNGLRAVIVDGAGVAGIAGSLAVMAAWGLLSFAAGLRLFRWG